MIQNLDCQNFTHAIAPVFNARELGVSDEIPDGWQVMHHPDCINEPKCHKACPVGRYRKEGASGPCLWFNTGVLDEQLRLVPSDPIGNGPDMVWVPLLNLTPALVQQIGNLLCADNKFTHAIIAVGPEGMGLMVWK